MRIQPDPMSQPSKSVNTMDNINNNCSLTLFAVPKAFKGHIGIIQKNAIQSWCMLEPRPKIILMGDDEGTREASKELGISHIPDVDCNEYGTPLINSIFERGEQASDTKYLAYINCDNILLDDFSKMLSGLETRLKSQQIDHFLLSSQRSELDQKSPIDFKNDNWQEMLEKKIAHTQIKDSQWAIEIFLYKRGFYKNIPAFSVGRPGWDAWMVWEAQNKNAAIIDASEAFGIYHQIHDYNHIPGGWTQAWWGAEAVKNQVLVQEKKRSLADATHLLTKTELKKGGKKESMTAESLVDIRLEKGIEQLRLKEYRSALDFFENARLRKGHMRKPLINLGRAACLMNLGRIKAASDALLEEINIVVSEEKDPADTANYEKGLEYHRKGMDLLDKAKHAYQKVINSKKAAVPHRSWAHFKFGELMLFEKKPDLAHAHFQQAVALKPDHPKAHIYLTAPEKPLNVFLSADRSFMKADFICIKMDIFDPELWKYYFKNKKISHALIHLETNPSDSKIQTMVHMIDTYLSSSGRLGLAFSYNHGNGDDSTWQIVHSSPDKLKSIFPKIQKQCTEIHSTFHLSTVQRTAKALLNKRRLSIAQGILETTLLVQNIDADNFWLSHLLLGKIMAGKNRMEDAGPHYKKALDYNPDCTEAMVFLSPKDEPLNVCLSESEIDSPDDYLNLTMDLFDKSNWTSHFAKRKIDRLLLLLKNEPGITSCRFIVRMVRNHLHEAGSLTIGFCMGSETNIENQLKDESYITEDNAEKLTETQLYCLLNLSRQMIKNHLPKFGENILKNLIVKKQHIPAMSAKGYFELGQYMLSKNIKKAAREHFKKAFELDPGLVEAGILSLPANEPLYAYISNSDSNSFKGFFKIPIPFDDKSGWEAHFYHRKIDSAIIDISPSMGKNDIKRLVLMIRNYCRKDSMIFLLFAKDDSAPPLGKPVILTDNPERDIAHLPFQVTTECQMLDAKQVTVFYNIGLEMQQSGQPERAKGIYIQLMGNPASSSQEITSWANFKYGEMLLYQGLEEQASKYFKKSLELKPDHHKAKIYLLPKEQPLNVMVANSNSIIHGIPSDYLQFNTDILTAEILNYYFAYRKIDTMLIDIYMGKRIGPELCKYLYEVSNEDGLIVFLCFPGIKGTEINKFILHLRGTGFYAMKRNDCIIALKTGTPPNASDWESLWKQVELIPYLKRLPADENIIRVGGGNQREFLAGGQRIFESLDQHISPLLEKNQNSLNILDFGSGPGRIAIPFMEKYECPLYCTDIDQSAIDFLSANYLKAKPYVNDFNPPLLFQDSFFDCVYSVSIWSHLPPEAGRNWLIEMARILKKGGTLLVTTGGYLALKKCKTRSFNKNWQNTSPSDLKKNGVIYKEYPGLKTHPENFPGVTASYGLTMYDPDFIRKQWGEVFDIIAIKPRCIDDMQDLIIMKKR